MKKVIPVSIVAGLALSFSVHATPTFYDVNEVEAPTASFGGWLEKQLGGSGEGDKGKNCVPGSQC